jgi:hypothetical protein
VKIEYGLLNFAGHQWGCQLTISDDDGKSLFSGLCGVPSKAPALDLQRNLLLLPLDVKDVVEDPTYGSVGSFGNFRGYLLVDWLLLERPDQAGPENIHGLTGTLTYQVAEAQLNDLLVPSPWRFEQPPGQVCVLSGRLDLGDVPQY